MASRHNDRSDLHRNARTESNVFITPRKQGARSGFGSIRLEEMNLGDQHACE
jgi:hypothetical protein